MKLKVTIKRDGSSAGADAAEQLLEMLTPEQADVVERWGNENAYFMTGLFAGLFLGPDWSMMVLSNAARAVAAGEVTVTVERL